MDTSTIGPFGFSIDLTVSSFCDGLYSWHSSQFSIIILMSLVMEGQ